MQILTLGKCLCSAVLHYYSVWKQQFLSPCLWSKIFSFPKNAWINPYHVTPRGLIHLQANFGEYTWITLAAHREHTDRQSLSFIGIDKTYVIREDACWKKGEK